MQYFDSQFIKSLSFYERFYCMIFNKNAKNFNKNELPKNLDNSVDFLLSNLNNQGVLTNLDLELINLRLNKLLQFKEICEILNLDKRSAYNRFNSNINNIRVNYLYRAILNCDYTSLGVSSIKEIDKTLFYLNLPTRLTNNLIKNNIKTIDELCSYSEGDLLKLKDISVGGVNYIKEALQKKGCSLVKNPIKIDRGTFSLSNNYSISELKFLNNYNIREDSDIELLITLFRKKGFV